MQDWLMTDEVARVEIDVRQLAARHFLPLRLLPSFASPAFSTPCFYDCPSFSSPANSSHPLNVITVVLDLRFYACLRIIYTSA